MRKICFFDFKPYDRRYFEEYGLRYGFELVFCESKLNEESVVLAEGCEGVIAFVNDTINKTVIQRLMKMGIHVLALRCAGYNNVDLSEAFGRLHVLRVPSYSPYAIAEFSIGLLLNLNRKLHRAYNRTREYNFSLTGLTGFDFHGKTIGVVGAGRIGQVFMDICHGFSMEILAYDPFPTERPDVNFVTFKELLLRSDMISLHCPLTKDTYHCIDTAAIRDMKQGVLLVNTSRGALIDTPALIEGLKSGKIGGAGLDVYEEEEEFFYEDYSGEILQDDELARLISMPNVLLTSHQAFLTKEALCNIAKTTMDNLRQFFAEEPLPNEVCYRCAKNNRCHKDHKERCF